MSETKRAERRLLSKDELELVERARHPALGEIENGELDTLLRRLRDTRDRAQGIAQRQRREMRGKSAPSGTRAASDNSGSKGKSELLSAAVARANKERSRRRVKAAREDLRSNARKSLELKREGIDPHANRPAGTKTPKKGMTSIANEEGAVSGAFDEAGHRPVLERSRKVR